jgi:predicted alpha-1,2-mannosidase
VEEYKELGYVPVDKHEYGTSMTQEYSIDDYSIAKICEAAGDSASQSYYLKRSQNVINLFNPETRFIQGKYSDGTFITPFDSVSEKGFNEGNAAQYFWSVPHSMKKLIDLAGGQQIVEKKLDRFIYRLETGWAPDKPYYWVGNEPCFGTVYVYNYLQKPSKTQYHVRRIMNQCFANSPDGLPGDDDAGALSALYIFKALGLYPYLPGEGGFTITGPLFEKIVFKLNNGNKIIINSEGAGSGTPFIQSLKVNGMEYSKLWIEWKVLRNGATLNFRMSDKPDLLWGTGMMDSPPSYFP